MTEISTPDIEWQPGKPRAGWQGGLDRFMGPDTTAAELLLCLAGAGGALVVVLAAAAGQPWSAPQTGLALLLAFDIGGGVIANATSSAKRWYHRAGQTARHHLGFVLAHLVHIGLLTLVWRAGDGGYALAVGGYLLVAAPLILALPLALRRPAAMLALLGGWWLNAALGPIPGLEWLLPALYLKLLVCHLVKEAPFNSPQQIL